MTMKMLRITLEGKSYEVGVEVLDQGGPGSAAPQPGAPAAAPAAPVAPPQPAAASRAVPVDQSGGKVVTSPMAGLVFKCLVKRGDVVGVNQVVVVLDAMKMETPVVSPYAGTVRDVLVREGDAVEEGYPLVQIEESP
ncbi:acetyl-CoA carboxylase biotin carboxyl carrier protein subunit [Geomonas sp. Red276]